MSDALKQARLDKLKTLREMGVDPYPARVPESETIGPINERFATLANEEHSGQFYTVSGRLMAHRGMGKASFLDVLDGTGKIQAYATLDKLGEAYALLSHIDVGDFVSVTGEVFRTKRGQLSIAVDQRPEQGDQPAVTLHTCHGAVPRDANRYPTRFVLGRR